MSGAEVPETTLQTSKTEALDARSQALGAGARRGRASTARLLAWGLLWAVLGVLVLNRLAPNPWPVLSGRVVDLRASLIALDHGGPALLGYRPGTHRPYAVGYSDDQGIYVIVPVLSHWLGARNPITVLRWSYIAAWALALLFSAVLARALFRSLWAGVIGPPTLLVCILSFGFGDIYWVSPWVIVVFLPLLVLLARRRWRWTPLALAPIALTAGIVSAVRSEAGLPVALAAVIVAALVTRRWPVRALVAAAVIVAYLVPTRILLPVIRAHRDHRVGIDLSANEPTSHPLWHSLYIGLGYTPNRYGIHYDDSYAAAAAREIDPRAPYLSPAYASALHRQIDALISHDPGFVARTEAQKADVELANSAPYLLLLALLLPAAMAGVGPARLRRRELVLFIPALVIGALPAIVAVPYREYELTLFGPLGALGLLAVGSIALRAETAWRAVEEPERPFRARLATVRRGVLAGWPVARTAMALLVALVLLLPSFLLARHLEAEHARWQRSVRGSPTVVLAGSAAPTT